MEDFEEEIETHSVPHFPETITFEVLPKPQETVIISTEQARVILRESQQRQQLLQQAEIKTESNHHDDDITAPTDPSSAGVHFLTDDLLPQLSDTDCTITPAIVDANYERKKSELLEYVTRHDGSVICKRCGELLASRTHWYRHKYKIHVTGGGNVMSPAPLFKCTRCNVFFKSRKGFIGHTSARHSENMEQQEELNISIKEEVVISTEELPKPPRRKEARNAEWVEQRTKEEQLVAAIIDRVKKECEAQGTTVSRRGYSRRSTVMMNSS